MGGSSAVIMANRPCIYRDLQRGLYTPESWLASEILREAVWKAPFSVLWVTIPFAMAGYLAPNANGVLGEQFLFAWGMVTTMQCLGYLVGFYMPHIYATWVADQIFIAVCSLLAGVFQPQPQIPETWAWLHEALPHSHMMKAVFSTYFYCHEANPSACPRVPLPTGQVVDRYAYFGARYGFYYDHRWEHFGWGILSGFVTLLFVAIAMRSFRATWTRWAVQRKRHHKGE